MSNVNINWSALGFEYQPIAKRYVANYKDGKWGKGELTDDPNVVLNECAGILQYCQQVFEGLKAYKTKDGRTVTFRPDQNAKRLMDSAKRCTIWLNYVYFCTQAYAAEYSSGSVNLLKWLS